ncbi:Gp15 family bacteriophage protein [Paucilactobacillus nenjiangensis]|uniref:Bacteriophage Gp15 protein n=1 Tax=Paucilactobacillus nenjiangensis TaxID=1296540 RepID=A0A5P1X5P7_9LACO|nr:Gp15 family bacteriophage protein [Paucilactobacillus nenjiangensis]QER67577.1 hypothetical protein F0161_06705 [Paucilactobacillus nenjiangensis]
MFSIWNVPDDEFEFKCSDGTTIEVQLDMDFANILHLFNEIESEESEQYKLSVGLGLMVKSDILALSDDDQSMLFSEIMTDYVLNSKPMIDMSSAGGKAPQELYNLTEDADYIYASFMQDYGIDLRHTRMHWDEFRALLSGLTDSTKFRQVVAIRGRKVEKGMSAKDKQELKDAQLAYALHTTEEDVEFATLDFEEREQYLYDHPEYAKRLEPE